MAVVNASSACKLGLVLPEPLHLQMVALAAKTAPGRGGIQRVYEAAFEALLTAVSTGEAVAFAAVRAPKVRVTLRLPKEVCARVRACLTRLTLKLTDFACAAVGRFLAAQGD